jgi:tetratricopeptide (TPR) repeat protein
MALKCIQQKKFFLIWDTNVKANREYGESIEIFKYLISVYPNSDRSYFYLGETYRENGDLDLAKESYRKTLVINPNFQQAIDRLKQLEKQK